MIKNLIKAIIRIAVTLTFATIIIAIAKLLIMTFWQQIVGTVIVIAITSLICWAFE